MHIPQFWDQINAELCSIDQVVATVFKKRSLPRYALHCFFSKRKKLMMVLMVMATMVSHPFSS